MISNSFADKNVLNRLVREMSPFLKWAEQNEEYEECATIRDQIKIVQHVADGDLRFDEAQEVLHEIITNFCVFLGIVKSHDNHFLTICFEKEDKEKPLFFPLTYEQLISWRKAMRIYETYL